MTPLSTAELATLSRLLDELLDLPATARAGWLDALPAEHAPLRPRLVEMAAQLSGGRAPELTMPALGDTIAGSSGVAGERIGPYRLLRPLGQGGMGTVWLAERVDGAFERQVALKLPRLAWSSGLAGRFARERRIGALLEHPNIARLEDAGADERGRPYLALAYIDGERIDHYVQRRALGVGETIALMLQVVHAVAHAHGRLVIHRDIKPGNLLVDAQGRAHLLDFGIGKLIDDVGGTDATDLTRAEGMPMTPQYAAPEQLAGQPAGVQADVYALGLVLYELLCGRAPWDVRRASIGSMRELLLQGDVPPPSRRALDPVRARALAGDLDAVVSKALEHDPAARYVSASALADDLERHLAGNTVSAVPSTIGYRLRKGLRRNWIAASAAAVVLVAVVGGLSMALVQAQRAERAAERERVVRSFVTELFRVNAQGAAPQGDARVMKGETLLEQGAELIATRFAGQPALQSELYGVVGAVFADMGAAKQALLYRTRRLDALEAAKASPAERVHAEIELAESALDDSRIARAETHAQRALAAATEAGLPLAAPLLALARAHFELPTARPWQQSLDRAEAQLDAERPGPSKERSLLQWTRALAAWRANRFDEAEPVFRRAIETARQIPGGQTILPERMTISLVRRLGVAGRPLPPLLEEADAAFARLERAGGAAAIRAAVMRADLYAILTARGAAQADAHAAIAHARRVVDAQGVAAPQALRDTITYHEASVYLYGGWLSEALERFRAVLPRMIRAADSPFERFWLGSEAGTAFLMAGELQAAEALFRMRAEARRERGGANHPYAVYDHVYIARALYFGGRYDEALAVLQHAPRPQPAAGHDAGKQAQYMNALRWAEAELELARGDAGRAWALTAALPVVPRDDSGSGAVRAEALCGTGRAAEGLPALAAFIDDYRKEHADPKDPAVARWNAVAGHCALALGERRRAQAYAALANHAFDLQPAVAAYYKAPLLALNRALQSDAAAPAPTPPRR